MRSLLAALVMAQLLAASPTHAAAFSPAPPSASAGDASVRSGEWVAQDAVFDATGPDIDGIDKNGVASTLEPLPERLGATVSHGLLGVQRRIRNGDYELPTDKLRWPDFTSDISEIRMLRQGDRLAVRVRFTSMPEPASQIVSVGFAGPAASSKAWPAASGVRGPWDAVLTMWGTGGALHDGMAVRVDSADHTFDAEVPIAMLPIGPWRVWAVAGLHDAADTGSFQVVPAGPATPDAPGSGSMLTGAAVFDVLNARGSDEPLDDRLQADALATGDLAHLDPHTIDPAWLTDDLNRPAPVRTGAVMRVHESRVDLGDGIRRDATSVLELDGPPPPADAGPGTEYVATGRLQPYAVVVPEEASEPMPVLVYLHGYNAGVDEAVRIVPELIDGAMESGFLVVAPYARGDTFCKGIGEIDVLEVLDDVARAYAVDADRVHLVGFSAGAACVNYLAAHNPDRWASVTAIAGTNEVTAIAENFRHVPWHGVSGTADIGPLAQELFEALAAQGFEASLRTYPAKAHEFGQVRDAADEILARIASGRRTTDPGIVTFVKPADADLEQFGLVHDGAYWVSGIEPADDGYEQLPRVEAVSSAIADVPIGIPSRQYVRVQSGDALGSRDASITRVSERGDIAGPSSAGHAELRSVFVAAYAVDLGRMGLAQAEHVNVETSADRDVRLSLLGIPHERILASVDGGPPLEVAVDDGVAVVTVPSGSHLLLIEPRF